MDKNTYQVIITNKLSDNQNKAHVIQQLAATFKISEKKAEQLISKPATIIKKNTDEATAKKFMASILITGANCKIINISKETHTLEAKEQLKLDDIDDTDKKNLCPECGTIKNFHLDKCMYCGFTPEASEEKKNNTLKYVSIILILAAVLVLITYLAQPYYKSFTNNSKIENDLKLAYDTRNKITTMILETNFWPNQNIYANLPKQISNETIESLVISKNAVMTVTLRAEALNSDSTKTIIFKPSMSKEKLIWNCTKGTLSNEFRPDICKRNN